MPLDSTAGLAILATRNEFGTGAPFSRALNVAVLHIAGRRNPRGWAVIANEAEAPSTLDALKAYAETHGRIGVWGGASDDSIFGDPEVLFAFRAWHDACHLTADLPFTPAGERECAILQMADLVALYGSNEETKGWAALIWADVVGSTDYHALWDAFPTRQRDFVAAYLRDRVAAVAGAFH